MYYQIGEGKIHLFVGKIFSKEAIALAKVNSISSLNDNKFEKKYFFLACLDTIKQY